MTHPDYIREKAIEMRVERQMSIDEIAERLALPKTTIYYWVKDIPLKRPRRLGTPAQQARNRTNSERYRALRDAAYEQGWAEFDELSNEPTFRDFVCMYIGEGSKRRRNEVVICNSDPKVIVLAAHWLRRLAANKVWFSVQHHADQDVDQLRSFWSRTLGVDPEAIRFLRKSNSNQLKGRTWRCEWGVLSVGANDTYFRARLQAWMDQVRDEWLRSAA